MKLKSVVKEVYREIKVGGGELMMWGVGEQNVGYLKLVESQCENLEVRMSFGDQGIFQFKQR